MVLAILCLGSVGQPIGRYTALAQVVAGFYMTDGEYVSTLHVQTW
jgi:hypothetical protein